MESIVKDWLRSESVAEQPGIKIYLFGSVLTSATPRDLDLVIIYDASQIDVAKAIVIRQKLREHIRKMVGIPTDIVLLSTGEVEQTRFLTRIEAVCLSHADS